LGRDALGVEGVLDGEGNSVQRTEFDAVDDGLVRRCGIPQCVVGAQGDDGVDLRIDRGDAVQVRLDDFAGRDLFRRDQRRQGGRIPIVHWVRGVHGRPSC
jgi:hypothetical protein